MKPKYNRISHCFNVQIKCLQNDFAIFFEIKIKVLSAGASDVKITDSLRIIKIINFYGKQNFMICF